MLKEEKQKSATAERLIWIKRHLSIPLLGVFHFFKEILLYRLLAVCFPFSAPGESPDFHAIYCLCEYPHVCLTWLPTCRPRSLTQQIAAPLFSTWWTSVQGWAHKRLLQLLTELPSQGFSSSKRCSESQKRCIMLVPWKKCETWGCFRGERSEGDICIFCGRLIAKRTLSSSTILYPWLMEDGAAVPPATGGPHFPGL